MWCLLINQIFKRQIESVHEGRNFMNVNIDMKDLMKNKTSKDILIWFMRGRNPMNVNIAMKDLMKKETSTGILKHRFRGEETLCRHKVCVHVYVAPQVTPFPSLHIWITKSFISWEKNEWIIYITITSVQLKKKTLYYNKSLSYLYLKHFIFYFLSI